MEPNDTDVPTFIEMVASPTRRRDAWTLLQIMGRVTGEEPCMWGPSIIGFGRYHYKYESGVEGDAGAAGFSPRKAAMTIYFPDGFGAYAADLERLGAHKTGVVCLYLKALKTVDLDVLESMITRSYRTMIGHEQHLAPTAEGARPAD